jgi:hypothetical protein
MDSFGFEFGGVKVLGAGGKISRAGWSQPLSEVVIGAVLPVRVNQGVAVPSTKSARPEIGGVMPLHTHPLPTNLSWLLSFGVLNSAESIKGMNVAALPSLHQLPAVGALRIRGA